MSQSRSVSRPGRLAALTAERGVLKTFLKNSSLLHLLWIYVGVVAASLDTSLWGGLSTNLWALGGIELSLKIESMKYDIENGYPSHAITSQTFKYYAVFSFTTN